MPGGAPISRSAAGTAERIIRPEFTGSAGEYFRIWIVNLFFTLITLGIYSAWAKVRKKRYFYGSTRFDGDTFDYFASPKTILKGRIVAVVVFVVYAFAVELLPSSAYAFWAAFLLVLPWLVMRSLMFNARNSAYRGLRFDFAATPREAVRVYFGMPIVVGLTLGLAFPWFMARQKAFVLAHHAFGTTRFGCDVSAREFFGINIKPKAAFDGNHAVEKIAKQPELHPGRRAEQADDPRDWRLRATREPERQPGHSAEDRAADRDDVGLHRHLQGETDQRPGGRDGLRQRGDLLQRTDPAGRDAHHPRRHGRRAG